MYILSVILYIIAFIFSLMTGISLLVKPKVFPYLNHDLKDKNSALQKRYRVANIVSGILAILLGLVLFLGGLLYFYFIKTSSFIPLITVLISVIFYYFIITIVSFLIIKTYKNKH